MPHTRRPAVSPHKPHHVTVRVTRGTWNLRSQRCFRPLARALEHARGHIGFRVVRFSVQHNHVHLIVEADDRRAMSRGLRALFASAARAINRVMSVTGQRFDDRYHEHILATPTEVRNALYYLLGSRAHHLARWGTVTTWAAIDPFSSVAEPIVKRPRSWLLREGGRARARSPRTNADNNRGIRIGRAAPTFRFVLRAFHRAPAADRDA